jgi:WD40 repeat protein
VQEVYQPAPFSLDQDSTTLAFVAGDKDKTGKVVGLSDGKERQTLEGPTEAHLCVAHSPDGKYIAAGGNDNAVTVWDAATGQKLATVDAHVNAVTALAFSRDGKLLATGSKDKTVKLWNVAKVLGK